MERNSYGKMFVMSSPSGAGKITLTKKIAENNSNFKISISYTRNQSLGSGFNTLDQTNATQSTGDFIKTEVKTLDNVVHNGSLNISIN